jgi:hypothetical protein
MMSGWFAAAYATTQVMVARESSDFVACATRSGSENSISPSSYAFVADAPL